MFEFLKAGGLLIIPILLSSIIAMAIVIERFMTLRTRNIIPDNTISQAKKLIVRGTVPKKSEIEEVRKSSVIGKILATGLENSQQPRHIMKESLEEAGRHAAHQLDRYMTALGTIAAITPLLGLLGTVIGMIQVFSVITTMGVGSPTDLAGGISTALITTAAGISVAVPALIFHRYFKGKINDYVMRMEQQALKLVELSADVRQQKTAAKPRPPMQAQTQQRPTAAARQAAAAARRATPPQARRTP